MTGDETPGAPSPGRSALATMPSADTVRRVVRALVSGSHRFVVRVTAPYIEPLPSLVRIRVEQFVTSVVAPHITPLPGPVRTKPRRGRVFDPPQPMSAQAWQPLLGHLVRAGDDEPAWAGVEPYAITGRVHEVRRTCDGAFLVIKSGQGRIVIDPRWWRITVLDGSRASKRRRRGELRLPHISLVHLHRS